MSGMRPIRYLAPLLGLLVACQALAPEPTIDLHAERIARLEGDLTPALVVQGEDREPVSLEQRMRALGVPGVSVAFIDNGEVAWTRAYGLADIGDDVAVTESTLFQAASISKPVAAMAALSLVEEGLLDLAAGANDVLTGWRVPEHDWSSSSPVTLRGLITHSAGLTVHGFPGYGPGEIVPDTAGVVAGLGNTPAVVVDVEPRSQWRYSGGGYTVMQLLLEQVSGRAFPELMAETVLQPLGMTHSTYEQPLPESRRARAATGYRDGGAPVEGRYHTYPEMAAAGLWMTPSDLARFAIAIQQARAGSDPTTRCCRAA